MASKSEKKVEAMEVDEVKKPEEVKVQTKEELDNLTIEKLKEQCRSLERGEAAQEMGNATRVLRTLVRTRKRLNDDVLARFISSSLQHSSLTAHKENLMKFINPAPGFQEAEKTPSSRSPRPGRRPLPSQQATLPEVEVYLHLLVMVYLLDQNKLAQADKCGTDLMSRVETLNRRSLDPLAAKCYYFYVLVCEGNNKLSDIQDLLHARLRTANAKHWNDSVCVLMNSLLRSYITDGLYSRANQLITKVTFPEHSNNNEMARNMYYEGRIRAVELEYETAKANLQQALRKAPQHTAIGFKQAVQKLLVVVELLLGEIPDRSIFRMPIYRKPLTAYLKLTQAVRTGDLLKFAEVRKTYEGQFKKDGTNNLIERLRLNVIKAGVRQIALAYSRIPIKDIARKLSLETVDEAEYIVSKSINDGVIQGIIDSKEKCLVTAEIQDIYDTDEPAGQFHKRIDFCLNLHNECVKAMRYPPRSYQGDGESAEEQREREQQELEFAKEMHEEDDDY